MSAIARWVTEHQAAELVNRTPRTLRTWRQAGEVIAHRQDHGRIMYLAESLYECQRIQQERYKYRDNPGRPSITGK